MRMVLTRLGERSRMVVTGDLTQVDLPPRQLSGLLEASGPRRRRGGNLPVTSGWVRHPLVQRVVEAYARRDVARVTAPAR